MNSSANGAEVSIENLTVRYRDLTAVRDVSVTIGSGSFVSLLGPSGSGKTTVLRTVAGFIEAASGRILVDGVDVTRVPTRFRNFGMVFQNYALFPHMSVLKNVRFGLRGRGLTKRQEVAAAMEMLSLVDLDPFADKLPGQLSGGQQQRVALARAIVIRPRLLLMDEPLAALDLKLRQQLQLEIKRIQTELGISALYVTHDQEEALTLSDSIVVMSTGEVSMAGKPADVYHRPVTRFAAEFVGNKSVVEVPKREDGSPQHLPGQIGELQIPPFDPVHSRALVVLQPEDFNRVPEGTEGAVQGTVVGRRFLGKVVLLSVQTADGSLVVSDLAGGVQLGDSISITWDASNAHVIVEPRPAREPAL